MAARFPSMSESPKPAIPVTSGVPKPLARARTIARIMDDSIPVPFTNWRIGLDPLLGFLPGMGDWMGWAISFNLMVAAAQLGTSASVLTRMLGNLAIDAIFGIVPLFGDLFDAGWKANVRNLKLLEQHVADPSAAKQGSRLRVGAVLGGTVLTLAGAAWGLYTVVREIVLVLFSS